tara:strand:+ start:99 stop:1349 length:1251 start_codon:yes stop_codon:yes gene_type:complete
MELRMIKAGQIKSCEACGNGNLSIALDLGVHPLCDDLIPIGDSRICEVYPIKILLCDICQTAHQKFQVPKRHLFPSSYHYRSRFTADVVNGLTNLVEECEMKLSSLKSKLVLDVGCNDGTLLDIFKSRGTRTSGIEPTDAHHDALGKGHIIHNNFFSPDVAKKYLAEHGSPDIITFTNVFAHIENLSELIEALLIIMTPRTLLVIENHYLGSVLDSCQFDTFYHEHPRTYSLTSFKYIAISLGVTLQNVEFPMRYGGNIRVMLQGKKSASKENIKKIKEVEEAEISIKERLKLMQGNIELWKTSMTSEILALSKKYGKLPAKAFPGRAAILIKILGINEEVIEAVYEKPGSLKIGNYVPGTRIPIKSDEEFFSLPSQPPILINFAWHISKEIKKFMHTRGYHGKIIDIFDPKDISI